MSGEPSNTGIIQLLQQELHRKQIKNLSSMTFKRVYDEDHVSKYRGM